MADSRAVNDASEIIMKACEQQTNALIYNLRPDVIEKKKRLDDKRTSCPCITWEQDMGFKVPYCGKTSEYCHGQCLK